MDFLSVDFEKLTVEEVKDYLAELSVESRKEGDGKRVFRKWVMFIIDLGKLSETINRTMNKVNKEMKDRIPIVTGKQRW